MSDWRCTCQSLFIKGCTCRDRLPRTMPINLLLSIMGWQRFWTYSKVILPLSNWPKKEPTGDDDILVFLIELEILYPDLYDELARKMEQRYKHGDGSSPEPTVKLNLWGTEIF